MYWRDKEAYVFIGLDATKFIAIKVCWSLTFEAQALLFNRKYDEIKVLFVVIVFEDLVYRGPFRRGRLWMSTRKNMEWISPKCSISSSR